MNIFRKSVEKIQVSLLFDKNIKTLREDLFFISHNWKHPQLELIWKSDQLVAEEPNPHDLFVLLDKPTFSAW